MDRLSGLKKRSGVVRRQKIKEILSDKDGTPGRLLSLVGLWDR